MKYDKFFDLAKEAGITDCELSFTTSTSLEISLFHGEINNYSSNSSSSYLARGIYKGKMGSITSDVYNKDSAELFVKKIIENASVIENDDPVFIFKGSEKKKPITFLLIIRNIKKSLINWEKKWIRILIFLKSI